MTEYNWGKIVEEIEHEVGMGSGGWDLIDEKELIMTIIDVAIKNGLASPAVWAVVELNGDLKCLYESEEEAYKHSLYLDSVIHWKGEE